MRLPLLERATQRLADFLFAIWPRSRPSRQALLDCRIVAHRGEYDNIEVGENTLDAFALAVEAGAWGIEFDVRWTRDLEPVVIHDPDTRRVFDHDLVIAEVDLRALRERVAEVPTLAEVVERFGGDTHLMIELKRDEMGADASKRARLEQILSPLRPARDYHVLALQLELFDQVDFAGDRACIAVAELNVAAMSRRVLACDYAGIGAQYLLLSSRLLRRHRQRGQQIGTGFVESRFGLYRELNREVTWIFSNSATRLCAIRQSLLRDSR